MEDIYRVKEAAEYLGLSENAVREYLRYGLLEGQKLNNRSWRITESALEKFVGLAPAHRKHGEEMEPSELLEVIENRPKDWWKVFGDIEAAIEYFAVWDQTAPGGGTPTTMPSSGRAIVFDWVVKYGEIDEDEAFKNVLRGCYWHESYVYLARGLINVKEKLYPNEIHAESHDEE